MPERSTLESFIVHIYRVDTENSGKIVGIVELTDGSGRREAFADLDELGVILSRRAGKRGPDGPAEK